MSNYIPLLALLNRNIFFALMAVIGVTYDGSSTNYSLIIFSVLSFGLSMLLYLWDVFKTRVIAYKELIILSIPIFYIIFTFMTVSTYGYAHIYTIDSLSYFIIWGAGAIFGGLYISRTQNLGSLIKNIDFIIILFALALLKTTIIPFLLGQEFETVGGETYQTASYLSALTFGLTLFMTMFNKKIKLRPFFASEKYYLVRLGIMLISFFGVFISGGRGGFVLLFVYLIYFVSLQSLNLKKIVSTILVGISISLIGAVSFPKLIQNNTFNQSLERITQFISSEGINWEGTSGRDIVYSRALTVILEEPFLGHGIGASYYELPGYPHNFYLELLLEGGILYTLFWIVTIIFFLFKLNKLISINLEYRIIVILFLYIMTLLMFSGSYMRMDTFWFVFALVLSANMPKNQLKT